MARFYRQVTSKTFYQEDDKPRVDDAELSEDFRPDLGRPRSVSGTPRRFRKFLRFIATSGVLAGAGVGLFQYFTRVPQDVVAIPSSGELSLGKAQRQLRAKLREIYRDCKAGPEEKAETENMLARHPDLARAYPDVERTHLALMLESCRLVRSGQTLIAQKLYPHARADFLRATEADPENANAWAALGAVNMLMQREEEARQAYEKALTVDPESWIAHYNYGFYFVRKGETDAAFLHLDRAISLLDRSGEVNRGAVIDDLRRNPLLEPLRQDPRFSRLLG